MEKILKINLWLKSTRPRTLPAAAAPVIIGLSLSFYELKIDLFIHLVVKEGCTN